MPITRSKLSSAVRILGATVSLPEDSQSLDEALREGLVSGEIPIVPDGFRLPIARCDPIELAAEAGQVALEVAGIDQSEIDTLFHAWVFHQGEELTSHAHRVARKLSLARANPVGIQQACNGAGAALTIAASVAPADTATTTLITTADVFAGPGIDRWSNKFQALCGDAGTAMVVTRDQHLMPAPGSAASTLVVLRSQTLTQLPGLRPDTGLGVGDLKRYLEEFGPDSINEAKRDAIAAITDLPVRDLSDRTGHLGAGDLTANLAAVHDSQAGSGTAEVNIFISAGAGFTITTAIIETTG